MEQRSAQMSLRDKLNQLDKLHGQASRHPAGKTAASPLDKLLPGDTCTGNKGPYWLHRTDYPLTHLHGVFPLNELLGPSPGLLSYAARRPSSERIDARRLVFFDTETTGLSGGVGATAFMIGLGYVNDDRFVVDQYFMRQFSEEPAMLHEIIEAIASASMHRGALVSYNGASFDLPLIHNRAVLNRTGILPQDVPHIDLLHIVRRLWKKYVPDCSLATAEARLLRVRRSGDIPSYTIPQLYFRFLQTGDPRPVLPVFYHNRMDILSMVTLLCSVLHLLDGRTAHLEVPFDHRGLGKLFEAVSDNEGSAALYERLLQTGSFNGDRKALLCDLARLHKKAGRYERACSLWCEALALPGFAIEPYEELAKVCEHRLGDIAGALDYTQKALHTISMLNRLHGSAAAGQAENSLLWRLRRLERKKRRAGKAAEKP